MKKKERNHNQGLIEGQLQNKITVSDFFLSNKWISFYNLIWDRLLSILTDFYLPTNRNSAAPGIRRSLTSTENFSWDLGSLKSTIAKK